MIISLPTSGLGQKCLEMIKPKIKREREINQNMDTRNKMRVIIDVDDHELQKWMMHLNLVKLW